MSVWYEYSSDALFCLYPPVPDLQFTATYRSDQLELKYLILTYTHLLKATSDLSYPNMTWSKSDLFRLFAFDIRPCLPRKLMWFHIFDMINPSGTLVLSISYALIFYMFPIFILNTKHTSTLISFRDLILGDEY